MISRQVMSPAFVHLLDGLLRFNPEAWAAPTLGFLSLKSNIHMIHSFKAHKKVTKKCISACQLLLQSQ